MSAYDKAQSVLFESILKQTRDVNNRKNLGPMVPIQLFQALRIVGMGTALEEMVGAGARAMVYQSGQQLGDLIGLALKPKSEGDLGRYVELVQSICIDLRIGEVNVEQVDLDNGLIVLRVDECVSCAGLRPAPTPICNFEAGMVGGIIRQFVGRPVKATETRCYATGHDTCGIDVHIR